MTSHQALYAIGDIQGCLSSLMRLLKQLPPDARLVFVGDLINRGPDSLATLRFVRGLGDRATCVLGNHDLHFLAVAAGIRPEHPSDTLGELLAAPDRDELVDWLRHWPLAHRAAGALFVHAGVLPPWSIEQTLALAGEVEQGLRADDWRSFLATMYGNQPARWSENLAGADRARTIINALTRLRFLTPDGAMDFAIKESAGAAPPGYRPWFDAPDRATADALVVFAHWSTLGLVLRDKLIGLDTGCVWGGYLTSVRLPDRAVFQVPCPQAQIPGQPRA
ncbi:MAG: symmetrical bis(5'-nucleosyl)-tetraphosphatase [Burkholderiaceae bacterium]